MDRDLTTRRCFQCSAAKKELLGFVDGARESAHDWRALLLDLKRRGLSMAPKVAVADGALGFWKAIGDLWPKTREQRCWVHKTGNILNKLPKSQQPKAKRMLQDVWMAETRKDAEAAFDVFVETYAVKYEKAAECLKKARSPLLAFYDFPGPLIRDPWMPTDDLQKFSPQASSIFPSASSPGVDF